MFRKIFSATIAGLMLSSTLVAASASAATISNGTPCPVSKTNKTTKVGSFVYKCTKNPAEAKPKLTWVSIDCLQASAAYAKTNASYLALVKQMPATLAALDVKIAAAQVTAAEASAKADAADAQIIVFKAQLVKDTAALKIVEASTTLDPKKRSNAITFYMAAIKNLNSAIRAFSVSSPLYRNVAKTVDIMKTTRATTLAGLGQTKVGVAQNLSMRSLVCGKGL